MEKENPVKVCSEMGEERSTTILRVGQEVLSITAGRRSPGDNETWRWNDMVQGMIQT